jgi:hypothetical protein
MKLPRYGLGLVFAASVGLAADAPSTPEWRGVIDAGAEKSFLVVGPGEKAGHWEKVGDTFGEWTVAAYREADRTLVVRRKGGAKLDLVMTASPTSGDPPPPVMITGGLTTTRLSQPPRAAGGPPPNVPPNPPN